MHHYCANPDRVQGNTKVPLMAKPIIVFPITMFKFTTWLYGRYKGEDCIVKREMAAGVSLSENAWTRLLWDISFSLFSLLTPNEQGNVAVHSFDQTSRSSSSVECANRSKAAVQVEMVQASSSIVTFTFIVWNDTHSEYHTVVDKLNIIPSPMAAWRWLSASSSNMIKCDAKREKVFLDPIIHMSQTSVGVNRITGLSTILCHKGTTGVILGYGRYKCNLVAYQEFLMITILLWRSGLKQDLTMRLPTRIGNISDGHWA